LRIEHTEEAPMSSAEIYVERVTYDGKLVYVDTEYGELCIHGTMDTFNAGTPIWGVFDGYITINDLKLRARLHFKDTKGMLIVETLIFVPIFFFNVGIQRYAFGYLNDVPAIIRAIPEEPWRMHGLNTITVIYKDEIISVLVV